MHQKAYVDVPLTPEQRRRLVEAPFPIIRSTGRTWAGTLAFDQDTHMRLLRQRGLKLYDEEFLHSRKED